MDGTLTEEETEMVETRENVEIRDIPSTSAIELESPLPQRKRRILKEEVQESWLVRRRRTCHKIRISMGKMGQHRRKH